MRLQSTGLSRLFALSLFVVIAASGAAAAPTVTYNNFGEGTGGDTWKTAYDGGAGVSPMTFGVIDPQQTPTTYQWIAVPFTPTIAGRLEEIYLALRFLKTHSGNWYEDPDQYFVAVVNDENGQPGNTSDCNGSHIITPYPNTDDRDPFPMCDPEFEPECHVQQ